MSKTELKPCPFCGGEARIVEKRIIDAKDSRAWIWCKYCGIEQRIYDTPAEAVEAWNRRVK